MMSLSRLVGRLSFPAKFFLIGLLFLIPVSILLLMVARNSLQDINTIRNEQAGLRINNQVRALLQHVQRHRGLSSLWLSGHQADEARLLATEGELDQLLRSIPPDLPEQLQRWGVADEWNKFTGEWTQIRGSWRSSDAAGNLNSHILLVQRLLQISRQIQDRSELALDPENESFHIQNLLFERLLQVTEQVGVARSTGVGVATRAQITQPERVKLAIAGGLIHQLVQSMRADLQGAYDHSPAFKAELGATNEALLARMDDAQQLILHDFVEQETVNVQPEQFFTDMSQIIDTSYQLYDQLAERLRRLLQQRYDNHVRYEASIGIVVVVTGLLALLMFMTIYRTLRASVHDLRNVSGLLATGDLTVRARIVGDDELTQIARAFNDMAQHLRTLIGEISGAVTQVQTSTVTMANSSANIARSSQEQSVSAASMAAAVEQMTVSVSLVADNTRETDKTASSSQNLAAEAQQGLEQKLPLVIAIVLLLSFILLMLAFRSIVVPLTAGLMNLISVAASYGVLVAVFEKGFGLSLIGLDHTLPIVSFVPLLMFAILFGLSMDYQVFLVTRMKETWDRDGDNRDAVRLGLAGSGKVVVAAATIMASVFLAFVTSSNGTIKMFGVALAAAVLVDAFLVRLLLVPVALRLLGRWAWWSPKALDRVECLGS